MTSQRSPPAASNLGARLRATAHEPDDDSASALRARLRHKMFGRGRGPEPPRPAVFSEPQLDSPTVRLPPLGWIVPGVAIVALVGMSLWLHRTRTAQPSAPLPTRRAVLPAQASVPRAAPMEPSRPDLGPALLEAAELEPDPATRSVAIAAAVQASWAHPSAPPRLDATASLADRMRGAGEPARALGLLRAVLDDLELRPDTAAARSVLLQSLAEVYDDLGRVPAAVAVRAEASRLAAVGGSH